MTKTKRRIWIAVVVVLVVLLLAFLPPLINVNRFSRRIASSISSSLGRPVTLDRVSMKLLPLPGFTIQNFVVGEDPRFGDEPVMRADTVYASLRWGSLWRGRLEISTISLEEPHVNLVRLPDGTWNIESILTHAAAIDSAPTQQQKAGPTLRFPYIEATDGRINLKLGQEKKPFSLTGAQFALWLPNPKEWRFRVKASPLRSDTDASDTGEVTAEGTLRRASALNNVPVQMEMHWRDVPLGEGSKVLTGRDMGWRGEAAVSMQVKGTFGDAKLSSDLLLKNVRRADFVPQRQIDLEAHCEARATGGLRSLENLRCELPVDPANGQAVSVTPQNHAVGSVVLTGNVAKLKDWNSADMAIKVSAASPQYALDWLRLFSVRVSQTMHAAGSLDGEFSYGPSTEGTWAGAAVCDCVLNVPATGAESKSRKVAVRVNTDVASDGTGGQNLQIVFHVDRSAYVQDAAHPQDVATPSTAHAPPVSTVSAVVNGEGFQLHVPADDGLMSDIGKLFPPVEDGMPEACQTQECSVMRHWGESRQVWTIRPSASHSAKPLAKSRRR